jgi:ATP-dependent metalloprotease FtsH
MKVLTCLSFFLLAVYAAEIGLKASNEGAEQEQRKEDTPVVPEAEVLAVVPEVGVLMNTATEPIGTEPGPIQVPETASVSIQTDAPFAPVVPVAPPAINATPIDVSVKAFIVPVVKMVVCFFAFIGYLVVNNPNLRNGVNSASNRPSSSANYELIVDSTFRFTDVLGVDEIKDQLVQLVDFLKNPEKYERFGAIMPKGYLLEGPPGVGKTLLAKVLAGEAGVPMFSTSGSAFEEALVGVGASRVRDLFAAARKFNCSIIFIDEIDAVAARRTQDGKNVQTLNQLLVEMDGFSMANSKVVIFAATNAYSRLDPAILRPGRFDKTFTLSLPDINGRLQIIQRYLKGIPEDLLCSSVDLMELAVQTIGFSGAELAQMVNQAKLFATIQDSERIEMSHFQSALNLSRFGPARNFALSIRDRKRVAFHEAGHAIVGLLNPAAIPIERATIIPHASSLGMVVTFPNQDSLFTNYDGLVARIDFALGGFLAEEAAYGSGKVSNGASSDLQKVNEVARLIVNSGFGSRTSFYQPMTRPEISSEFARQQYEADIHDIIQESKARVRDVFITYNASWRAISDALLESETLSNLQLRQILDETTLNK